MANFRPVISTVSRNQAFQRNLRCQASAAATSTGMVA
jgi:hypothetical protein